MMKIVNVVGARPNFMKIAPIMREMARWDELEPMLLHTGQHYDEAMSKVFFDDLQLPQPDIYLGVGSGSHAEQTARVMVEFEKAVVENEPDLVVVVGDVNSTVACTLVAAKLGVKVAHVEAGLRSFDRGMPEEINRLVTDALADLLLTSEEGAAANLSREGVPDEKIHFVGNVMIDSLLHNLERAQQSDLLQQLELEPQSYAVLTLHRPSNVDEKEALTGVIEALDKIQQQIPVMFPIHPRTQARIESFGLSAQVESMAQLRIAPPLGYLDFIHIFSKSALVLTDSGGIQEETTALGIPCITLRENTERPITVTEGTNTLVGSDRDALLCEVDTVLQGQGKSGRIPKFWDGKAAERIVSVIRGRN